METHGDVNHGACSRQVSTALCITFSRKQDEGLAALAPPPVYLIIVCIWDSPGEHLHWPSSHRSTGCFCLFSDEEPIDFAHFRSAMFIFILLITRVLCIFWKGVPCGGCENIFLPCYDSYQMPYPHANLKAYTQFIGFLWFVIFVF